MIQLRGITRNYIIFHPFTSKMASSPSFRKYDTMKFYCTSKVEKFQDMRSYKSKHNIDGLGWFLLIIPVGTFFLGTWQIKRKKWKENLIEDIMIKMRYPPIELPHEELEVEGLEYRKVHVRGKFDHSGEMYIGPRSLLKDGDTSYGGKLISKSANISSGYYVVTPFILSDTKERVLVNRGWIPLKKKVPASRPDGQIDDEVDLVGVIRLSEPRPPFVPRNKAEENIWFTRDVELMSQIADTRPIFIEATVDYTIDGGPIGGQTRVNFRNEHLSYIITWYSLSAATAFMWFKKYFK